MAYVDRAEAIKAIRNALRARSGRAWSVTGDRGTAYGWIHINAPKARRGCSQPHDFPGSSAWNGENVCTACSADRFVDGWDGCAAHVCTARCYGGYMVREDRLMLAALLADDTVGSQGVSISPDSRNYYVAAAAGLASEASAPAPRWD